jgi:hypothetical protein
MLETNVFSRNTFPPPLLQRCPSTLIRWMYALKTYIYYKQRTKVTIRLQSNFQTQCDFTKMYLCFHSRDWNNEKGIPYPLLLRTHCRCPPTFCFVVALWFSIISSFSLVQK